MIEKIKSLRMQIFITALCYIGLGVFFVVASGITVDTIIFFIAAAAGVFGIAKLVSFFILKSRHESAGISLPLGLLLVIGSIFFFINPGALEPIVYVILGFAVVAGGLLKLQMADSMKDEGNKRWVTAAIAALVMLVLGLVALFTPFSSTSDLIIMIGISMIVSGAFDIVNVLFLLNKKN